MQEVQKEFRSRMQQMDVQRERAVEEAERRTSAVFEERMRDFISLQVFEFCLL